MRIDSLCTIGLALAAMMTASARAENFQRGQELFEHQCQACHDGLALSTKKDRVKTLSALRVRIAGWAIHSGAEWGNSEIDDVLYYLNKSFYRYKEDEI